ncbi:unnamed protein product [Paramecium octaurelia]|uniref:Uncharacterized protein n=1 Tax=Paramecium octaurelia TaxID=43137 RepID=A0A8S1WR40_PAROT|nr:unnamed protein product [Paramecium octaurelia]
MCNFKDIRILMINTGMVRHYCNRGPRGQQSRNR